MLSGQPQGLAPTVNNRKKESLKLLAALSPVILGMNTRNSIDLNPDASEI
jgi:hypothetical protein